MDAVSRSHGTRRLGSDPRNAWQAGDDLVDLRRPPIPDRPCLVAARPQDVILDLNRTAIVVVDMQNDFCAPDGWIAGKGADIAPMRRPIPILNALLPVVRAADIPVIWVNWGVRPDVANLPPSVFHAGSRNGLGPNYGDPRGGGGEPVLVRGGRGAAVVEELRVEPHDILIDKHRFSAFQDSDFDGVLRNRRLTTLLFTGINIDRCVLATLMDASFLGYDCILVEDACSTPSPAFCTQAVTFLVETLYGFTTTTTGLKEALGKQAKG